MGMDIRHDNIHFTLPNGAIFSIACLNGRHEVAVMSAEGFIPTAVWYYKDGDDDDDPILPITGFAKGLDQALDTAIQWAEDEKNGEMARALDQAL